VTGERLAEAAALYDLDLARPYVTVCAAVDAYLPLRWLTARLRSSGETASHRVLLAVSGNELLAVAPRAPSAPPGVRLAIGPPALLSEAGPSFAEARRILETAAAFGVNGVVELHTLGALSLVTARDEIAPRLDEEWFGQVDDRFADVERTVLRFLESGQRYDATAMRLHVHPTPCATG
jgi:hypothetical protein